MKKKKHPGGRPRELGASIAINLRLPAHAWAELQARAEHGDTSMSQLARDAICGWLEEKPPTRKEETT